MKYLLALGALLSLATPSHAIINCTTVDAVQTYADDHGWELLDYEFDLSEHSDMVQPELWDNVVGGVLFDTERGDRLVIFARVGSNVCTINDFIIKSENGTEPGEGYSPDKGSISTPTRPDFGPEPVS